MDDRKNALVTGASGGIGMAIVGRLAVDGYDIYACMRTEKQDVLDQWDALSDRCGVGITPVFFDLESDESILSGLSGIVRNKDISINLLVNNAGMPYGATTVMTPMNDLRRVMQVNYFGAIQVCQLVLKKMMRQKSGVIVNIASVGGIETKPGYLAYGSSKAALIHATKIMAGEVAAHGIRVNAVAPGLVDTPMGHFKDPDEIEKVLARTPAGRMGKPEEVASLVAYLASDEAAYITGQVLAVDGGRT